MIFWELILGMDDKEAMTKRLRELYEDYGGVSNLALHLGVSRASMLKKLKECGIERKGRGGPHFRMPREALPSNWWKMDTDQLVRLTGYTPNYIRRLRREQICNSEATSKATKPDSPIDSSGTPSKSSEE